MASQMNKNNAKRVSSSPEQCIPPGFNGSNTNGAMKLSEKQIQMLRYRSLFAFRFLVGRAVNVTLIDNRTYTGILDCIDPETFSIVLKNTQEKCLEGKKSNVSPGATSILERAQIAEIVADGSIDFNEDVVASLATAKASAGFRTDGEISTGTKDRLYGRELQSATSWLDPACDAGNLTDESGQRNSKTANWDQFEANKKLFGVVSTYDESLYTTKLDRANLPEDLTKTAERIAREIERQPSKNPHVQEERGQCISDNSDEESRYSSVDRKSGREIPKKPGHAAGSQDTLQQYAQRSQNAYIPPPLRNKIHTTGVDSKKSEIKASGESESSQVEKAPGKVDVPKSTQAKHKPAEDSTSEKNGDHVRPECVQAAIGNHEKLKNQSSSRTATASPDTKENMDKRDSAKVSSKPAAKKGLNPNAKEFVLNPSAAAFSPKGLNYATAERTQNLPTNYSNSQYMRMRNVTPPNHLVGHDSWTQSNGEHGLDENDMIHSQHFMGYGLPAAPVMMQQQMYQPMMPHHVDMRMRGEHRPYEVYGYQRSYNPYPPAHIPLHNQPRDAPPLPRNSTLQDTAQYHSDPSSDSTRTSVCSSSSVLHTAASTIPACNGAPKS